MASMEWLPNFRLFCHVATCRAGRRFCCSGQVSGWTSSDAACPTWDRTRPSCLGRRPTICRSDRVTLALSADLSFHRRGLVVLTLRTCYVVIGSLAEFIQGRVRNIRDQLDIPL